MYAQLYPSIVRPRKSRANSAESSLLPAYPWISFQRFQRAECGSPTIETCNEYSQRIKSQALHRICCGSSPSSIIAK